MQPENLTTLLVLILFAILVPVSLLLQHKWKREDIRASAKKKNWSVDRITYVCVLTPFSGNFYSKTKYLVEYRNETGCPHWIYCTISNYTGVEWDSGEKRQ